MAGRGYPGPRRAPGFYLVRYNRIPLFARLASSITFANSPIASFPAVRRYYFANISDGRSGTPVGVANQLRERATPVIF